MNKIGVGGLSYAAYLGYAFFAPRYEQVRFDTFKQSQSYNDGMIRDLQNIRLEYMKANDEQKAIILHRFSVYQIERLPYDIQVFYRSIN